MLKRIAIACIAGLSAGAPANAAAGRREFRNPNLSTMAEADGYNVLPIEFFVYGEASSLMVVPESEKQFPSPSSTPHDKDPLSDHCPSSIKVEMD